ncbi:hypothetical protein, partial [Stenotrophomonas maltophilia]|uniref:hypothetical protein n=1 Tax=Stenotrophomonas maltophilia TaxID=40324 RepID=UPI001953A1A7
MLETQWRVTHLSSALHIYVTRFVPRQAALAYDGENRASACAPAAKQDEPPMDQNLRQQVLQQVRAEIISGQSQPGTMYS